MSTTTATTSPATSGQCLTSGSLSTASIVFMVIAAAAPPTVIGGAMPIGMSIGNGAGFPAMYALSAVILKLLVSMAVVVWFRTRPDLTVSTWKRLVAPALSFLGLGTALFFIVTNFTVLFGSVSVAWIMAVSAPVVFVLGAAFATFVTEYDDKVITRNMAKRMVRDKSGDQA